MAPPKPDIECEIKGTGLVSFELVEIIHREFASATGKEGDTKRELYQYYSKLKPDLKLKFDKLFNDALLFFRFHNRCTFRERQQLFPLIFSHLLNITPGFEGEALKNIPEFNTKLKHVTISRGTFSRPVFKADASGAFDDPTISAISSKFQKAYRTNCSIHLLGYIELTPMIPVDMWLSKLKEFVEPSLKYSQFEKVWIYDVCEKIVKYRYP